MDAQGYKLWHLPLRPLLMFEDLSAQIHPADRARVRSAFAATRAIVGSYEIDFRIMVSGDVRWISARGQGDDADIQDRLMFGIFIDVTGRKQAEEAHELLAGEMSHRVKNLLAIAAALTTITSRSAVSTEDMARELTDRLVSLGRAHDLVRPLPGHTKDGALLGDLISVLLAPYDDKAAFSSRIRVAVPRGRPSDDRLDRTRRPTGGGAGRGERIRQQPFKAQRVVWSKWLNRAQLVCGGRDHHPENR